MRCDDAGRADPLLERYRRWLIRQVEQAGVELALGRRADVAAVRALGADEIVVATGARWEKPDVPGADLGHVRSVPEIAEWLRDDDGSVGGARRRARWREAGISIADVCVRRGRDVTVLEPTDVFCGELGLPGRWRLVADIERAGARLVTFAVVRAISPHR